MPGRSRGGNAAGNFHPRPGPASRLPRTGRGHRGGPDDRARPLAGRWEGAIHLLYEVPTQRPASRLLPRGRFFDNGQTGNGAWRWRNLCWKAPSPAASRPPLPHFHVGEEGRQVLGHQFLSPHEVGERCRAKRGGEVVLVEPHRANGQDHTTASKSPEASSGPSRSTAGPVSPVSSPGRFP